MKRKDYFVSRMFYRLMIPSVISSFGFALADMADSLVVGQKLGEVGLAAISLCLPIFMIINLFMDGLGIGGSVAFSKYLGEGNMKKARECFNRTWISTLAIGVFIGMLVNLFAEPCLIFFGIHKSDGSLYYACREYMTIIAAGAPLLMLNVVFMNFLRNDNNIKRSSIGFLLGNAVDISLNIIFVIFLGMGTRGAALSTVIGSALAICIYMPAIFGRKADTIKIEFVKIDISEVFGFFKTGFATSVRHIFQFVFLIFINRLLMSMSGESGVAIFNVVYNVSFFILYVYNGITEAMQPLVSTFTGENSEEDCRRVLRLSRIWTFCLGAVVAGVLALNAESVALTFGVSQSLLADSGLAIRIYCAGFALLGINIINEKYYQSKDYFLPSFLIVVMREFVVLLSSAAVLSHIGIAMIWLMYPITELVTCLIFAAIKILVVRDDKYLDENQIFRITLESENDIEGVLRSSSEFCARHSDDIKKEYAVTLIIEELCMSIVRNAFPSVKNGKIRITLLYMGNVDFVINILDNAVEFNPFLFVGGKSSSENEFNIDEVSVMMVKNRAKKFMHHKCAGFNSLVVHV